MADLIFINAPGKKCIRKTCVLRNGLHFPGLLLLLLLVVVVVVVAVVLPLLLLFLCGMTTFYMYQHPGHVTELTPIRLRATNQPGLAWSRGQPSGDNIMMPYNAFRFNLAWISLKA
jgi:hypothetical protein